MGSWGSNLETIIILQQGVGIVKQGVESGGTWREASRILTVILLGLLLPMSFLLLARLSTAHYLAAALLVSDHNSTPTSIPSQPPTSHLLSFLFFYCNTGISTILYALVSLITFAAFVHGLTGRRLIFSNISRSPAPQPVSDHIFRPRLYAAWIILCTLQVCVGLGVEGSIDAGIDGFISSSSLSGEGIIITSLLSRIMFFVGLHETMQFWSKSVVKPVVDDTVMGFVGKEKRWAWCERVGMGLSFGTLWWWKLRDEVGSLVVATRLKRELQPLLSLVVGSSSSSSAAIGVADFVGWWLYYLTVTIGSVRLVKGGIWLGMILLFKRRRSAEEAKATTLAQDRVPDGAIDDEV